ncbi:deoxyribonuclease I [uncultured Enterococcus sp.]|uniref:endonuclease III domain-containing protein n=1 Tax=uncultured Enterococcus sp. TaxID=167972 RepID=UPI002AA7B995|nr:deoxyribonuclease I [uncultured Enterococcus sp.]
MIPAMEVYEQLKKNMPERLWWPAESKWEIIIGSILVQNTNWTNVEYSLHHLREKTQFEPEKIADLPLDELQELIRPSGFFINKGKAIQGIFSWLQEFNFDLFAIENFYGDGLRKQLLGLRGVGDETADVLLVYVFDGVEFIADRYAQRLFSRLGVEDVNNYKKLKKRVHLPADFSTAEAKEFHGLIVDFGKDFLKNDKTWTASFLADFTFN